MKSKGMEVIDSATHYFNEAVVALEQFNFEDCIELLDCVDNELKQVDTTGDPEYSRQRATGNLMVALSAIFHSVLEKALNPDSHVSFNEDIYVLIDEAKNEFGADSKEFQELTYLEEAIRLFGDILNG